MNDTFRSQFRLPYDLADKLRESAEHNNRSMNAEIVARLEQSFAPTEGGDGLGYVIEEMVQITRENEHIDRATALERLVAKGYAKETSAPVFIFYAQPGMTVEEIRTALLESQLVTPPDAQVFFDRTRTLRKPPKPTK